MGTAKFLADCMAWKIIEWIIFKKKSFQVCLWERQNILGPGSHQNFAETWSYLLEYLALKGLIAQGKSDAYVYWRHMELNNNTSFFLWINNMIMYIFVSFYQQITIVDRTETACSSLALRQGGSRSCVWALSECVIAIKRHDLDTVGINTALSLDSSITWLVQCCWHQNFYTTELCECFRVVSSMTLIYQLRYSVLVLFVFHRVFAPSFHISTKRNCNTSWPFISTSLPRLLLLNNSRANLAFEL